MSRVGELNVSLNSRCKSIKNFLRGVAGIYTDLTRCPEKANGNKVETTAPLFESKYYTAWHKKTKTGIEAELENIINPALQNYEDMFFRMIFPII